jgi:hypothetical protein
VRFFGALRFGLDQLDRVHELMMAEDAVIVVASEALGPDIARQLVSRGWPIPNTKPPEEVLEIVCPRSGVVMDAYGSFDDPEVAVAVIGTKDLIQNLDKRINSLGY